MFPVYSFDRLVGSYVFDIKLFCDLVTRSAVCIQFTHLFNKIFRKDRQWRGFSFRVASFCVTIPGIISSCSKEQMSWVNTGSHIAFMKDAFTFFYFSIIKFPGKTMGCSMPSNCLFNLELSITGRMETASPQPAITCFVHIFPKSLERAPLRSFPKVALFAQAASIPRKLYIALRTMFVHLFVMLQNSHGGVRWHFSMA